MRPAEITAAALFYAVKGAAISTIMPVTQIWFMFFSRYMDWWPEPGIFWFDWLMSVVLPGYAVWQSMFG